MSGTTRTTRSSEGRLRGGPLCFWVLLLAGCAAAADPGRTTVPEPAGSPFGVYREQGMLTGPESFPVVASLIPVAGPADSAFLLVALSLPNSALRFQREPTGFAAAYTVELQLTADDTTERHAEWRETVRVASFGETLRTDESVVFQRPVTLAPGRWVARLVAADAGSSRGMLAVDTIDVPRYGHPHATLAPPMVAYRAAGRTRTTVMPDILLNPRSTVAYGADAPVVYVELYAPDTTALHVRVRDAADAVVWDSVVVPGGGGDAMLHATVTVPADALPLGRLAVELEAGSERRRAPLFVTVSDQWVAANFEEVLQFLAYVATAAAIDSLRAGDAAQRRAQWDAFWRARDPLPATPANEFRDELFARIRTAMLHFTEPGGRAGWQTARGEVFIVLGPPDHVYERYIGRVDPGGQPNALEWAYRDSPAGRLELVFIDRTGFGRFDLEPASRAAFRSAAERMKRRLVR